MLPRKLLATDLDGTFLTSDGSVTEANNQAIKRARAAGLRVVFITGRPARWLRGVATAADHFDLIIGANGGFVADMQEMKVISNSSLDNEIAKEVVNRILEKHPDAKFGIERSFVGMPIAETIGMKYEEQKATTLSDFEFAVTEGYGESWAVTQKIPVAPIHELITQSDITKLIVKPANSADWNSDTWLREIAPVLEDIVQVTHASQEIVLTEISAKGTNKGTALAALCDSLNLTKSEVVAVGDMPNDVPMLEWVGEPWTVANAHPEVLAVTKNVLPHHDESPVAKLIDDLLSRN